MLCPSYIVLASVLFTELQMLLRVEIELAWGGLLIH